VQLWEQPARRLPVTLRPVHQETIPSYLHRLAQANHITLSVLLGYLGACTNNATRSTRQRLSPTHDAKLNAAALHRLATLTSQAIPSLHRALPALALSAPADGAVPTITWLVTGPEGPFAGYARCLARRGVTSTAIVYLPVGRYLCVPLVCV
jgi:hypothetical protein